MTGGHFNEIPVLAKAKHVFTQNNLYALGHGDETRNS
jgi:hypothetical protein